MYSPTQDPGPAFPTAAVFVKYQTIAVLEHVILNKSPVTSRLLWNCLVFHATNGFNIETITAIMMKLGELGTRLPKICVEPSRPYLLIRPKDAPSQWIGALENWCFNAPGKECSNRVEAAKRVLQQYANPQNSTLDLSRMELTSLPPGLSHLANLQELNVSQNLGLRTLPDDLSKCTALRSIDASSCSLTEWPACLSELPSLKTLLLDDNPGLRGLPDQIRERCERKNLNLSMEATMPRDFNDPPKRSLPPGDTRGRDMLPPGEARGRAMIRSASSSPRQPHGNARTRSASPPPHATAPSAASMIGFNKAHQLDKDYGSLQWPFRRGEPALKPWERDAAGTPLMLDGRIFASDEKDPSVDLAALLDLEKLKTGKKKYIWIISKLGRLIISEERQAGNHNAQHATEPQYIGHPALVGGGQGRISGELLFKADPNDPSSEKFYINNASGRFSKFIDRNEMQLKRVAELFRKAGLAVETQYRKRDKLQPVAGWQASS